MGSDLSVVNAARVSFDKESALEDGVLKQADERLIHYLAKHKHLSPFNHTFICLRATVPLFVARQLVKHEYMPWNEVSRRYVDSPPQFHYPTEWRKAAENVKQGSSSEIVKEIDMEVMGFNSSKISIKRSPEDVYRNYIRLAEEIYTNLINGGVCPEQARMILPQSMLTTVYWSGTLGAVAKMLSLRLPEDTQKETREVAAQVYNLVEPVFPISLKALLNETYGLEIK
ncbi:thymidylate synthase [Alcaligenes phage vB_Af_QDWS535]|nr:thymidylate synthase [Alcaligenes phage vB_Af_QDWS535]